MRSIRMFFGIAAIAACSAVFAAVFPAVASASSIADRATLNTLLGGSAVTEDFEAFASDSSGAYFFGPSLDSTTVANGQGPGLVVPGVVFTASDYIQVDNAGYFGAPSDEILAFTSPLLVDFLSATAAFGVDIRNFEGYAGASQMTVYGEDDLTVLGTLTPGLPATGIPLFVGWDGAGSLIGSVSFSFTDGTSWSPSIDNLTFGSKTGTDVPEPGTALLFALGALGATRARARKR